MANTIQMRRGTAADATTNNVVLAAGEWGYETDTGKVKIGDGVTAWNSLPYFTNSLFLGTFLTLAALTAAHPAPAEGSEAHINEVGAQQVQKAIWDSEDSEWVIVGSVAPGGSSIPVSKTGTNIVFTEDALYNEVTPLTSGNLTLSLTGAVKGASVLVFCDNYIPQISGADYKRSAGNLKADALNILSFLYDGTQLLMNVGNVLKLNPISLSLTPRNQAMQIDWSDVPLATGYVIERATDLAFTLNVTTVYTGPLFTFLDTGLTNLTEYYYRGKAIGGGNRDSDYSAIVNDQPEFNILLNNLVAAYKFEDNVNDFTGTHNGTVTTLNYVTQLISRAGDFTAIADNTVVIPDHDDFTFSNGVDTDTAFTIALSLNMDVLGGGIIGKANEWELLIAGGLILFNIYDTSPSIYRRIYADDSVIGTATNRRLVITFDGAASQAGFDMYVDGVLQTAVTRNTLGSFTYIKNTTSPLQIGFARSPHLVPNGRIDQVQIYKGVKWTQTEVNLDYEKISIGEDPIPVL